MEIYFNRIKYASKLVRYNQYFHKSYDKSRTCSTIPIVNILDNVQRQSVNCLSKIQTLCFTTNATTNISPLTTNRNIRKKRKYNHSDRVDKLSFETTAYAIAEQLDLEMIEAAFLQHGLYCVKSLPDDVVDTLYIEANHRLESEPREIFIYRDGCVVFWNISSDERKSVLGFLKPYLEDSYDSELVDSEFEMLTYSYGKNTTRFTGSEIIFNEDLIEDLNDDPHSLEKYSFSNALALSVKLSIWESKMDEYVNSMQCILDVSSYNSSFRIHYRCNRIIYAIDLSGIHCFVMIHQDLKAGEKLRTTRANVLQRTGELFTIRHLVNLSSDLLDTPDFYWDRENLEPLFLRTFNHLSIARRTKVMNEKLTHCCEVLAVVRDHLNGKHSARLEWIIIVLIAIEVSEHFYNSI